MTKVAVLVVEDNPANLLLMQSLLSRAGFEALTATSVAEARSRLRLRRPDLILVDIQLPGEDGLSLVRELRASAEWAATPILAVTANAMGGDEAAALAAGCTGYIAKPIDTRRFGDQVNSYLTLQASG